MAISKKDFLRIADGLKYVANDPTADHSTVVKMVQEFSNAAIALNPLFQRWVFVSAVFGESKPVLNPWDGKPISCGACGFKRFYNAGRSLDTNNHECGCCGHMNHTMTETGMSA